MPEKLFTATDAAGALGMSVEHLQRHRTNGTGPTYIKLSAGRSGRVRYRSADIAKWIADRQRESTAEATTDVAV